jgi:ABC-type antimicrobial peptide transport system permease subunit
MTTIGWWVRQRTREMGVRVALGASRREIARLVVIQGLALAGTGIAIGSLAAAGLTRYLSGWIYGITPLDPRTFALCAAGMLAVAFVAAILPVRQATSVDPVVALRSF